MMSDHRCHPDACSTCEPLASDVEVAIRRVEARFEARALNDWQLAPRPIRGGMVRIADDRKLARIAARFLVPTVTS